MAFAPVPGVDARALPPTERGEGTAKHVTVRVLNRDPATGGELWLAIERAGFRGGIPGHAHYLPVDEEAFFLDGEVLAGDTSYTAGDYLFYPAGFVHHPTRNEVDSAILIRTSGPMAYVDVPLPGGRPWRRDDERNLLPGAVHRRRPISHLDTNDLPWERLLIAGAPSGERVKLLSKDRESGACTFLWQAPAGWRAAPASRFLPVREWFVLSGDLRAPDAALGAWWYRRSAVSIELTSQSGCLALCWSDGPIVGGPFALA